MVKLRTLQDRRTREGIAKRVCRVIPGHAPLWGSMSAHQMICHLADTFRLAPGAERNAPGRAPMSRTLAKWTALYIPARWPRGLPTPAEFEPGVSRTPPSNYEGDRAALLHAIERFAALDRIVHPHPALGRLTRRQWMRWAYLHTDHHLRQFGA